MVLPYLQRVPNWIIPGATFDLDFSNVRYWGGAVGGSSITTAGTIGSLVQGPAIGIVTYAPTNTGFMQTFPIFSPRVTRGRGLWAEGNYTNTCLQSNDFTNASWVKTTMTTAKNQVGVDGVTNGASLLTATAPAATVLQTLASSSTIKVFSIYMKAITVTGAISLTLDGVTYTDISSLINTSGYVNVSAPPITFSVTTPIVGIQMANSGDSVAVQFAQCENNQYPTTPLPTTTTAVARGVDEPAHSDPGGTRIGDGIRLIRTLMCNGAPWSVFVSASANTVISLGTIFSDGGFAGNIGTFGAAGSFQAGSGPAVATTANTGTFGLGNINKLCGRARAQGFGGSGLAAGSACLNGGAIATSASGQGISAQSASFTHIGLGNRGAGNGPLDGYIKRLTYWNRELTDGEMINLSRSDSLFGN